MPSRPTIGVVAPWSDGFYLGYILLGIHAIARQHGMHVLMLRTRLDSPLGMSQTPSIDLPLGLDYVAGWIAIADALDHTAMHTLVSRGIPLVTVSHSVPNLACPAVSSDNFVGTATATQHLIDHGHTRIAFLGAFYSYAGDVTDRYAGYQATLAANRIALDPALVFAISRSETAEASAAAQAIFAAGLPCTAFVTDTDRAALGVMQAALAAGYRIPQDLAIIGFDDADLAQYATPPLTSVRQQPLVIGQTAAELLLAQARGEPVTAGPRYAPIALVRRQSCGCGIASDITTDLTDYASGSAAWQVRMARKLIALALFPVHPDPAVPPETVWPGMVDLIAGIEAALADRVPPPSELTIVREPVALEPLLQGVMATAIGLTKDKGLEIDLLLPDKALPAVLIDKIRIRQVLLNLLSNPTKVILIGPLAINTELPERVTPGRSAGGGIQAHIAA